MSAERQHLFEFGPFRIDAANRLLLRGGEPVPLTPKAFDTLLFLVQNSGRLLDKDELMKALWPDSFVEEGNLSQNVFVLRKALGQSSDQQPYIVTVPGRGYRFAVEVRDSVPPSSEIRLGNPEWAEVACEEAEEHPEEAIRATSPAPRQGPRSRLRRGVLLGACLVLAGVGLYAWLSPPPPRVLRMVPLTHFGRVEVAEPLVTDGGRLYFTERTGGHWGLAQVSAQGGEPVEIPTPFPSAALLDISPDRSQLLVGSFSGVGEERALWILPVQGGSPRRVGDAMTAIDAVWTPDGQRVVYPHGVDIYVVNADGSEPRKLLSAPGPPAFFCWSPDGRRLRFSAKGPSQPYRSLWEVTSDGSQLHPVLPGWNSGPTSRAGGLGDGGWTPDSSYFVFALTSGGANSFWAVPERRGLLQLARPNPVLLSAIPFGTRPPTPSRDGRRLFFVGAQSRTELVRYDAQLRQFVPFLAGIPARLISFSPDHQWVAYTTDNSLWRSRADGSDRLQLSFPPLSPTSLSWSPDGKTILFAAVPRDEPRVYRVSLEGGLAEDLAAGGNPDWSPDGESMVFDRPETSGPPGQTSLWLFDVKKREARNVPGSKGLQQGMWLSDGQRLIAESNDFHRLAVFDLRSQRWTELAQGGTFHVFRCSRDGTSLYYQDVTRGREQPVFRLRLSDRKVEQVTNLKEPLPEDVTGFSFAGLAPDDSPLATLIRSNSDIYALDVAFP